MTQALNDHALACLIFQWIPFIVSPTGAGADCGIYYSTVLKMKISRALVGAATIWSGVGLRHPVLSIKMMSKLDKNTCDEWTAQMPTRTEPGIIMQAVSEAYLPAQKNFIVFMEANSGFTRENIYLIRLDKESQKEMANVGIPCVPVFDHDKNDRAFIWKLRVKVLSCLLAAGFVHHPFG